MKTEVTFSLLRSYTNINVEFLQCILSLQLLILNVFFCVRHITCNFCVVRTAKEKMLLLTNLFSLHFYLKACLKLFYKNVLYK